MDTQPNTPCPSCRHTNRPGRRFCAECGARLAVTCAACGTENEPGEKFCGNCGEDLLSHLVQAGPDGDRLSDDEVVTMASLLFGTGFETTTNLFGNGLLALLRHPDQLTLLRRDPSLFANLPDELRTMAAPRSW